VSTRWDGLVRGTLAGLEPYRPGATLSELRRLHGVDDLAKLNWNEGLDGPLPGVREAIAADLGDAWAYPDEAFRALREALAAFSGTTVDHIVPGHGIQALIGTIVGAFLEPGVPVVIPHPTYGLYATSCAAAGAHVERVPSPELRLDLERVAATARQVEARLVWVCDPNNPTGSWLERDEWAAFLDALPAGCVVVADEAYGEYVEPEQRIDRVADVHAGRPVIVLRTFSKIFGMAGLRLGYAIADPVLAGLLDVVQEPFNVNCAALSGGLASLSRADQLAERRARTAAERALLAERLEPAGMRCLPSRANFVLVETGGDDVALVEAMVRHGVLVRAGSEFRLTGHVRITTAAPALMERAAAAVLAARGEQQAA
jgi:histidinol-phosphate aminotransferase